MQLKKAFNAYCSWVKKSKSPNTARAYIIDVERFIEYVGSETDSSKITTLQIAGYQDTLEKKGLNSRSVNRVAYAIISFLKTLGRLDISGLVPTPVYEAKLPKWLPEKKVFEVIGCCEKQLDRAILSLGYELAMRRGEIPLLNREWYHPEQKNIKVHRLKHRGAAPPEYVLPIREWAMKELDHYLKWRTDSKQAMFISNRGKRIHTDTILKIYRRTAVKARINIPFHCFTKHSRLTNYAIWMIEKHGQTDITKLARFAGHKNPASTLIYAHLGSNYLSQGE